MYTRSRMTSSAAPGPSSEHAKGTNIAERNLGAMLGIYGNTKTEGVYAAYQTGPDGKPLDGTKKWVRRYPPGQLPPVNEFWSRRVIERPEARRSEMTGA